MRYLRPKIFGILLLLSGSNVISMVVPKVVYGPAPSGGIYHNKDVIYLGSFAGNVHNTTYFQT